MTVTLLTVIRGHFVEYLLEHPDVAPVWDEFINHPFVLAMGDGTLPLESFKQYLIQDYLYLVCRLFFPVLIDVYHRRPY